MADSNTLLETWYGGRRRWLSNLLLPLSWFFRLVTTLRRAYYCHFAKPESLPVPVLVVGNITLGGSGKSPLLITLAQRLRDMGYSPGVVSRGYGSRAPHYPFLVSGDTAARMAGDEPLMIAQRTGCPVVIAADRLAAARKLLEAADCDLILSDDGLQHYRLPRDLEIIVVDGQRRLGNERLLPAGPLREPLGRLRQVNWVVVNGVPAQACERHQQAWRVAKLTSMSLQPLRWRRLADDKSMTVDKLPWAAVSERASRVHAVAGIGNPDRFFDTLKSLGLEVIAHRFPDHHQFQAEDIAFADSLPVVMTEKDAVKCRSLFGAKPLAGEAGKNRYWYLSVEAQLSEDFYREVDELLRRHIRAARVPDKSKPGTPGVVPKSDELE